MVRPPLFPIQLEAGTRILGFKLLSVWSSVTSYPSCPSQFSLFLGFIATVIGHISSAIIARPPRQSHDLRERHELLDNHMTAATVTRASQQSHELLDSHMSCSTVTWAPRQSHELLDSHMSCSTVTRAPRQSHELLDFQYDFIRMWYIRFFCYIVYQYWCIQHQFSNLWE